MAITKEQKKEILADLVDKFSRSKTVVFADYRGLDVASISELRDQLREGGSECKVAKKTLIKLAAKENKIEDLNDDVMEGPVAATFSYEDELSGLKILFNFSKKNNNLKLLGGVMDGKVVSAAEINALAKLPSREELLAKMIGSMNSPVSGFVGILGNLIGGLMRVLGAYKDTLPADASAEAAAKEDDSASAEEPKEEPKEEASAELNAEASPEAEAKEEAKAAAEEHSEPSPTKIEEAPKATEDTPAEEESEPEAPAETEGGADENSSEEEDDLGEAANDDQEEGEGKKEEEA